MLGAVNVPDLILAAIGALVTAAGVWLAHSYRRSMRLELAEARRQAYSALWELTGVAAPTRLDEPGVKGCFPEHRRRMLYEKLTNWYYESGHGMLLGPASRDIYLKAKPNLIRPDDHEELTPLLKAAAANLRGVDTDDLRGMLSIRQFSLLRTQLKADLAIYGRVYADQLTRHERLFLESCNKQLLKRRPWRTVVRKGDRVEDGGVKTPAAASP